MSQRHNSEPNRKSSKHFGLWFGLASLLALTSVWLLWKSPQSEQAVSLSPASESELIGNAEGDDELEYRYRVVERDGGRAVAVPKRSRPQLVDHSKSSQTQASTLIHDEELLAQITQLLDEGNWPEAESLLLEFLADQPGDELALIEMAMIQLIERRDPIAARQYLERAVLANPDNDSVIHELLVVYQETNNLEGGLQFLQALAAQDRSTAAVEFGIANALAQSGRVEEALQHFQRAMDLAGDKDLVLQEQAAMAFVAAGRFHEGTDMLRQLIEVETDTLRLKNLMMKLAAAYLEQEDRDEALRILYDAQRLMPGDEMIAQIIADLTRGRL